MLSVHKRLAVTKSFQGIFVILFLLVSLFSGSLPTVSAQDASTELFSDSLKASPQMDRSADSFVMRSRFVSVNFNLLLDAKGNARGADQLPQVALNIFPDARYTGLVSKVQRSGSSTSWIGSLAEVNGGYFYLVVSDGAFIAHVASTDGVYEISSVGDGVYQAIQIDQSKLVDDYPGQMDEPGPTLSEADLGTKADTGSQIDIMVVYTAAALRGEGSLAALKARIALAVTETNTSYANAGVTTRLRLVHVEQVTYTESGNIGTDVNRLAAPGDGFMDNVHAIRNAYGADMVSLVVENGGGYCGMARAIMATAATAFQVTARNGCMTGYYSFGHEFGHLQGARHDVYVDSSTTPFAYGHGYVNTSSKWRTVMAYNNKCQDLGVSCTRLQYWSNPGKTYGGAAMGNTVSKNFAVLNATDTTVANFRTAVIGTNFTSNFNSSSTGWTVVKGTWALDSGAYYKSDGLDGKFASTRHSGKYGDLTFTAKMYRPGTCTACITFANTLFIRGNSSSFTTLNDWKPSYEFSYTNNGTFAVWYLNSAGTATYLKDWTSSSAIVQGGWNTLKVVAVGSLLKFYINGSLVWSGSHAALKTGAVGIGFYRETDADTLYIDSASLSTTATADVNLNAVVTAGKVIHGGTNYKAP